MPRGRVAMRKTREILRLVWLRGQSRREAAKTCGVSKGAVDATVNRATAAGLSWPLPADLDDEALELRLYPFVVAPAYRKLSRNLIMTSSCSSSSAEISLMRFPSKQPKTIFARLTSLASSLLLLAILSNAWRVCSSRETTYAVRAMHLPSLLRFSALHQALWTCDNYLY